MTGRRGLSTAVLLCLLGAFVVLVAVGRTWAQVDVPAGPISPGRTEAVSGTDVSGGLRALGLVGLAGVVALAATRRTGRLVVGVLLALTGAGVVAAALGADVTAAVHRTADGDVSRTAWPAVTAFGGALLAVAGAVTVARGRSWPGLGQRYDAPSPAPAPTGPASERALWEALDRGEDPTEPRPDQR